MRLSMKLLTDAVPASGSGVAGVIDTDIVFDEYGIPYIPARRIKGVLRESALMLIEAKEGCSQQDASDRVGQVFGLPGMSESGTLRLSDGHPVGWKSLRDSLAWTKTLRDQAGAMHELVSSEAVLDYFTYLRTRTAIDSSTGTAKEDTLRVERVLRAGLVFDFDLKCPESSLELIRRSISVTRSFGLGRTRGMGLIAMELLDVPSSVAVAAGPNSEFGVSEGKTLQTLEFAVENIEPLLTSRRVGIHTISDPFISGAAVLGAVAAQYLRGRRDIPTSMAHLDEAFRRLFLDGEVTFSDLLPVDDTYRYVPAPLSVLHIKDRDEVADMSDVETRQNYADKEVKGHITEPIALRSTSNGLEYSKQRVEMQVDAHHRRPLDKSVGRATQEDDSEFYQFEVLSPGQMFGGSITGPRELLACIQSSLTPGTEIFLGKSKAAEYGRCKVVQGVTEPGNSARWSFSRGDQVPATSCPWDMADGGIWTTGSEIRAWAISDIILRDSHGVCRPDPQLLAVEIGRSVGSDRIVIANDGEKYNFVETVYVGGYKAIWRLPAQQVPALARGSVVLLRNDGPDIPYEKLAGAVYGEKTSEGFGRVLFLDQAMNMLFRSSDEPKRLSKPTFDDKASVVDLFAFLFNRSVHRSIQRGAAEKRISGSSGRVGGSLRRFAEIVDGAASFEQLFKQLRQLQGPSYEALKNVSKDLYLNEFFNDKKSSDIASMCDGFRRFIEGCRPAVLDVPGVEDFLSEVLGMSVEAILEPTWNRYRLYVKTLVRGFELESRRTNAKSSRQHSSEEVTK